MSTLVQRGITGIIFVTVMIAGIYGGRIPFQLLFALITVMSIWEYLNLTVKGNLFRRVFGTFLCTTPYLIMAAYLNNFIGIAEATNLAILFLPILMLIFLYELTAKAEKPYNNIGHIFLALLYIGVPFALLLLVVLGNGQFRPNIVMGILIMTWMNDTGAYLVGSKIGKTKLFPRISPKKTWEGSLGGVFVTFIVAYILSLYFTSLTLGQWLILGALVAVFGSLGDLVESMLKRSINVKDSGNILPGHGGMLDRFDAFIFLIPFASAFILVFC